MFEDFDITYYMEFIKEYLAGKGMISFIGQQ